MENLKTAINKISQGAIKSFTRFPISVTSAIIISIAAIIKTSIGWDIKDTYSLLLNSIQLAFLLGAIFAMAVVVYNETAANKDKNNKLLIYSNVLAILVPIVTFILLYFLGSTTIDGKIVLSTIAVSRVVVATFVSAVLFVYLISMSKIVDNFSDAFFISHKAFVISAIYGLVLLLGIFGVLAAIEALIYRGMSSHVYSYFAIAIAFVAYSVFLGYFPDFKGTEKTDEIKVSEQQPRFIVVLFANILVPIMLALGIVLLIWSVQVLFNGIDVSFQQLSSIASTYVIIGIWLHIMVANHDSKIANFYKLVYPFSGLLILALQAWALIEQIGKVGIQNSEYSFAMLWIFALISVIILILLKSKPYRKIAITAMVISTIVVMPIIGYQDITFKSQVGRLEKTLKEKDLLIDNSIVKANKNIDETAKYEITDAVRFIVYSEKTNKPVWFVDNLNDDTIFKNTFGFDMTYGIHTEPNDYFWYTLTLKPTTVDISDYSISLNTNTEVNINNITRFDGPSGQYEVIWETEGRKTPKITIKLNNTVIIEKELKDYIDQITKKYPYVDVEFREVPLEDMSVVIENDTIEMLIVFNDIGLYIDKPADTIEYSVSVGGLFIKLK